MRKRVLHDRRRSAVHLRALAWGWTVAVGVALPAPAAASSAPAITVGEPAGFADLGEQSLLVDVYFGGVRRGEAIVAVTPDSVRIANPEALLALLPNVSDRQAVEAALAAANLQANSDRACSASADRETCGRLSPEIAGVILDRDKLRLDVFLNPRFLSVQDNIAERYLPAPAGGLSMINAIGAVLSGSAGTERDYYNLQDQLVLADGPRRLRADLTYASRYGLQAEQLAFEWDRPEVRYSAGALWAPGNDLTGRRKLLGLGVETQIDTRLDRDKIVGSPIVVYLDHRARIDVVRDGRVLNSATYEAGNQQVDTSNLPDGSYEVVLRIDEPGQQTREERRFFTKSRRIPSLGRTDFWTYGGVLIDGDHTGSLEPSRHPFLQGGIVRRLSESWALEGEVQATDRGGSAEFGATLLTRLAQIRVVAVADLDGRYGAILQAASSGTSRFNFNFDMRHIEGPGIGVFATGTTAPARVVGDSIGTPDLLLPSGSYSQAGGVLSYSISNVRFLGVLSYRDAKAQAPVYSFGPSLQWDVLRQGPFTLTLRSDMAMTERGTSAFAGVSLRLLGARTSVTALGGGRTSSMSDDDLGDGPVASLAGSWTANAAGGELAVGAGIDHQPREDDFVLSSEFRHPMGTLSGDFVSSDNGPGPRMSQYSVGLQTTIAAGGGAVRTAGKTTTGSIIVVHVDGARNDDRFEVLVNEQIAGMLVGNRPLTLALPTYRAYQVRIRSTGKDLLAYDSSPRSVGLYPGGVSRLEWKVAPVIIKFGRLVAPDGAPITHASIMGKGVWSETDDGGFFQIVVADDAELTVTLRDGRSFATTLPRGAAKDGIAQLGSVACCGDRGIQLGTLAQLGPLGEGETK